MDQEKDKKDSDYGTLVGLRELLRKHAEESRPVQLPTPPVKPMIQDPTRPGHSLPGMTVMRQFAYGGDVQPVDVNDIPPAVPNMPVSVPQLSEVATSLNQTPDTNYDFFKDISAADRAALQQKLMAQQTSAPNMIAQGVAGLGDAISNSYGGKNTTFQKDAMANNELQQKKQLDAFDTQRSQKLQDMNANLEMQSNDPNSPLSQSMRKIVASQGVQIGSKMPASMMLKVLGPLGELAMKQAQMEQTKQLQQQTIDIAKQNQKTKEEEVGFQQDKEASTHWLLDPKGASAARSRLAQGSAPSAPHGIPDLGETFNGGKVLSVKRVK